MNRPTSYGAAAGIVLTLGLGHVNIYYTVIKSVQILAITRGSTIKTDALGLELNVYNCLVSLEKHYPT